jgi:hypothetical protein
MCLDYPTLIGYLEAMAGRRKPKQDDLVDGSAGADKPTMPAVRGEPKRCGPSCLRHAVGRFAGIVSSDGGNTWSTTSGPTIWMPIGFQTLKALGEDPKSPTEGLTRERAAALAAKLDAWRERLFALRKK